MRNEEPTRTDPPPVLTGDLEADAAASLGWLRAHPERWLEDPVEDHRELGGAGMSVTFAVLASVVTITPNASGLPGSSTLISMLGGLQFDGVLAAIAGVIIGAAVWALSAHANNYQGASRGRSAVIASGVAALLIGFGPGLVQALFSLGQATH